MSSIYRIVGSKEFFKSDFTQFQFNHFYHWRWLFINHIKFEVGRISGSRGQGTEMWTIGLLTDGYRPVEMWWQTVTHGGGKWRGNWRMEWVASTLHTNSEHGISSNTTADAHTSAASSGFKWIRPFRLKTKSAFWACAITFQTQSTYMLTRNMWRTVWRLVRRRKVDGGCRHNRKEHAWYSAAMKRLLCPLRRYWGYKSRVASVWQVS